MKVIAFHLPQFHCIRENDEWWGKGFTEWTNTKKAQPLFNGHYQPREPVDDNYYDLSRISDLAWQAKLAAEHGIYGFCFYHYWFNGKKLLEKPIEDFLSTESIDFPFCLSWANEPWTRTWDGASNAVLMPQHYGGAEDWERHFKYLLQYFRDSRYVRIADRPMLLIYRSSSIPEVESMIALWQSLARKVGIKGLYIVETMNNFQATPRISQSDAVVEFEPMYTLFHHYPKHYRAIDRIRNLTFRRGLNIKRYDRVWNRILNREVTDYSGRQVIPSVFPDWDNSPRKGEEGLVLSGANPTKFKRYLQKMMSKAKDQHYSDFLFINAWNEWAEGAYLEPDKRFGSAYLEGIRDLTSEF